MSKFFNIRAFAGAIILEIYGVITEYDMFEEYLRWQISEMGEDAPLHVRMSSPGGDPRIAMSLYRIIKDHKGPTTCYIEYMCDSAAPCISSACDKVIGNKFPFEFMIHDPSMQSDWFGVEEGQALVDFLAQTRDDMIRIFTEKTGQSEDTIRQMMKDTTFMNAQEALEFGFIDEIQEVEQTLDAKVDYQVAANKYADVRPEEFKIKGRGMSSESSNNNSKTKTIMSDNKNWLSTKMKALFGKGDDTEDQDLYLDAKELKAKVDSLESDIEEKDTEITKLKADLEEAKGKLPSEEEEEEAAEQEVEAQLEAAVKSFKIQASQKEQLAKDYKGKPEELKKVLAYFPEGAVKGSQEVKGPKTKTSNLPKVTGSVKSKVTEVMGEPQA